MRRVGILGGTFDPIHYGHIRLAQEAVKQLDLDQVRLIPLNIPPHRNIPVASAFHRQAMLELAINDDRNLCIDLRELKSEEVSYTINTLKSLRQEFDKDALYLILGRDAFNKIDSWKDWQLLLDYAHIIVANRPGEKIDNSSTAVQSWVENYKTEDMSLLLNKRNGCIYFIDIPMLNISSSTIREQHKKNNNIEDLLPIKTLSYMREKGLYLDTT